MDSNIRKIILKIHQYSGIISGLPVFVVCFTGALYVFRTEITDVLISLGFNRDIIDRIFSFIIDGHQFLWLPSYLGKMTVTILVVIYLVALLSGAIVWLPKHLRLKFLHWHKYSHLWQFIIDTHILSGIYLLLPILLLCITGIIYGMGGVEDKDVMRIIGLIHRGQFCGLAGKILMLIASLVGALLSISGYIITIKRINPK